MNRRLSLPPIAGPHGWIVAVGLLILTGPAPSTLGAEGLSSASPGDLAPLALNLDGDLLGVPPLLPASLLRGPVAAAVPVPDISTLINRPLGLTTRTPQYPFRSGVVLRDRSSLARSSRLVSLMPIIIPKAGLDRNMPVKVPGAAVDYLLAVKTPDLVSAGQTLPR